MSNTASLLVLALAALLEAGGDALMRAGLLGSGPVPRIALLAAGTLMLGSYGLVVNLPPWDFGRLLGVYVALFFVAAQCINLVVFGTLPRPAIVAGGTLILAGGLLMTFWR